MLSNYWKFPNRNVQTFGFVYHDTNGLNHAPVWKTQSFLLSEICMVIIWQDCYGKGNWRKSCWNTVWKRFPIGNAYLYLVKKDNSYLCMWMTKLAGKQNIDPMWKVVIKEVDLGDQTSFLDHVNLGCTQRQCEISKDIVDNYRTMWNPEFPLEQRKITMLRKSEYLFVVPRYGRACQEMCGAILSVGK